MAPPSPTLPLVAALARGFRRGSEQPSAWDIARSRFEFARAVGPRHLWLRYWADRRYAARLVERRRRVHTEIWCAAAAEIGARVEELSPGLLEIRRDGAITRIRQATTPLNDPVAIEIASDKPLAYRLLQQAGVPVPERLEVATGDLDAAASFLERIGGVCVVKPARGGGGAGVTGGVTTVLELRRALRRAARFHRRALVERQVAGDAYRILVLDGNVLDVLRRPHPRITGDGRRTVEQLLFAEYERRIGAEGAESLKPFVADLDCLLALEAADLGLRSVLPLGAETEVHTTSNYNGSDQTEIYRGPLADEMLDDVRTACAVLGLRFAGADVLTSDAGASLRATGGALLELNPVPGLLHHYNTSEGDRATPVAVPILRALLGTDSRD